MNETHEISHNLFAYVTESGVMLSETIDMAAPTITIDPDDFGSMAEFLDEIDKSVDFEC